MASDACEVIEFIQPQENDRNLCLFNISSGFESDVEVHETLWDIFSKYGLLFELQVRTITEELYSGSGQYYAFVKFFSARAAAKAHRDLTGRLYLKGSHVRVKFSNRKKNLMSNTLYSAKCYDLANFYLGFNGWSTNIISMTADKGVVDPGTVRYFCILKLTLPSHDVSTEGVGTGEKSYNVQDPSTKSVAMCMARKRAHQHAVEAAFARIVLVVLPDGRVYADVNTTIEDTLERQALLNTDGVVKVNELEEEPADSEEDHVPDHVTDPRDQDLLNQQILAQLEEDG